MILNFIYFFYVEYIELGLSLVVLPTVLDPKRFSNCFFTQTVCCCRAVLECIALISG